MFGGDFNAATIAAVGELAGRGVRFNDLTQPECAQRRPCSVVNDSAVKLGSEEPQFELKVVRNENGAMKQMHYVADYFLKH